MDELRYARELRKETTAVGARFVEVELDLAITFCEVALAADNRKKFERNVAHARSAYKSATRSLDRIRKSGDSWGAQIKTKLAHLKKLLAQVHVDSET
jgi:septal ring factor EnvC (AmiA/AmiB activator)